MKFPLHGWIGLVLLLLFWSFNWGLDGLRTQWAFFPMWLGYVLFIDALVCLRKPGGSIFSKSKKRFISLFLVSMPFWWLFELIDLRTQYWVYIGREEFTDLQYFLYASLSFSTVIPAVFETTDFLSTFRWTNKFKKLKKLNLKNHLPRNFFILGWILLAITLWKPQYSPAFLWTSLYFIFDPINYWLGNPNLLQYAGGGNWKKIACLSVAVLICGFFWEFWNFYSFPKWTYDVPYVDFWHLFEMPLVGYLGYIPFSFELFALYHLVTSIFNTPTKLPNLC